MCEKRILGRIASQRPDATYSKGKAFFGATTQQTVDAVRNHGNKGIFKKDIESFTSAASLLLQQLARLEVCKPKDVILRIKDVVRAAYQLNKASDFDKIFSGIDARQLNPNTRTGFIRRLGKLARYLECALYLLELSKKKCRLFERTVVTTVSLDPKLFSRSVEVPADCRLTTCLARCQRGSSIIYGAKDICSRLETSLDKKSSEFMSTVKKALGESRAHAEVQIVSYYELHPAAQRPRVIRSSKDACYLCNLFIQLHGAFYVPRTHGNLYCGWRFLPIPALSEVQTRFNRALETRIRDAIQNIMAARNPRLMLSLNSNESTIFPLFPSMSSLSSSGQVVLISGNKLTDIPEVSEVGQAAGPSSQPPVPEPRGQLAITLETLTVSSLARPGIRPVTPEPQPQPQLLEIPENVGLHSLELRGESVKEVHSSETELKEPSQVSLPSASLTKDACPPELRPETDPVPEPESKLEPVSKPSPQPAPDPLSVSREIPPTPPPSPHSQPSPRVVLIRDEPASILFVAHTKPKIPTYTTETGLITVLPEFLASLTFRRPLGTETDTRVRLHWLPADRAAAFYVARPRGFIPLETMEKGVDVDVGNGDGVYLAYGGEVVMVEAFRGAAARR